jgi:hypothetical protein
MHMVIRSVFLNKENGLSLYMVHIPYINQMNIVLINAQQYFDV